MIYLIDVRTTGAARGTSTGSAGPGQAAVDPVGEALRLWVDLLRHDVEAKFLYFPTEQHGIARPGNVQLWFQTVFAFLDATLHGKPWKRPPAL